MDHEALPIEVGGVALSLRPPVGSPERVQQEELYSLGQNCNRMPVCTFPFSDLAA
jgi:hypothetical protein